MFLKATQSLVRRTAVAVTQQVTRRSMSVSPVGNAQDALRGMGLRVDHKVSAVASETEGYLGVPDFVYNLYKQTKSNPDFKDEVHRMYDKVQELSTMERDMLKQMMVADMSYGALSLVAHFGIQFSSAVLGAFLEGHTPEDIENDPSILATIESHMAEKGEGGVHRDLLGKPGGGRAFQYASGGFDFNVLHLLNIIEFGEKLSQGAKPADGGVVDIFKVLSDKYLPKIRGLVPQDCTPEELGAFRELAVKFPSVKTVSSPKALKKSIEELTEVFRIALEVNPGIKRLVMKFNATQDDDVAGFIKVLITAIRTYDNVNVKPEIYIAGAGGGSGNTKHHKRSSFNLPADQALHNVLASEGAKPFLAHNIVGLTVDGGLVHGGQLARLQLMRWLLPGDPGLLRFGFGNLALWGQGCIQLRQCHKPNGCTVAVASHNPDFLKNYQGSPLLHFAVMSAIAKDAVGTLNNWGVHSLVDRPRPSQVFEMLKDGYPFDIDAIVGPDGPQDEPPPLVIPDTGPPLKISHELEQSIVDGAQASEGSYQQTVEGDARSYFGPSMAASLYKAGHEEEVSVNFTGAAGAWFGSLLEKGQSVSANDYASDSFGRFADGKVILKGLGVAGDRFGEQSKWNGTVMAVNVGDFAMRQAQGGRAIVCSVGSYALELCRTAREVTILGQAKDWGVPENPNTSFLEQRPTIGESFGFGAFAANVYMPKTVYESSNALGVFDKSQLQLVEGHKMPERDLMNIRRTITEYCGKMTNSPIDHIRDFEATLEGLAPEQQLGLIADTFVQLRVGPQFMEMRDNLDGA